jgi:hypothetical protein
MKIYNCHWQTGEYIGSQDAPLDPLESLNQGKEVYLMPAHSTVVAPPDAAEGNARIFKNGAWTQIEDHRGTRIYKTSDASEMIIAEVGAIPEGFTLLAPCEFPVWDGTQWTSQPPPPLPDPLCDLVAALMTKGVLVEADLPTSISAMPTVAAVMNAKKA